MIGRVEYSSNKLLEECQNQPSYARLVFLEFCFQHFRCGAYTNIRVTSCKVAPIVSPLANPLVVQVELIPGWARPDPHGVEWQPRVHVQAEFTITSGMAKIRGVSPRRSSFVIVRRLLEGRIGSVGSLCCSTAEREAGGIPEH